MKNLLKQELGIKLRHTKELQRELSKLAVNSQRAIEIRKELGIATLKDMLGDKYPIRICRHCGKRALNEGDLWKFVYRTDGKYQRDNCCIDCQSLLAKVPNAKIVGEHCLLKIQKACVKCGRKDNTTGSRSWFLPRATVCKECLGTHSNAFGFPLPIQEPTIIYTYRGYDYQTISSLAEAMGLSYYDTRMLIIKDKLKEQ